MKDLLESTLEKRKQNINNKINSFSQAELNDFNNQYDKILKDGFEEYIKFKHKYEFNKEENLLEFMRDYKEYITAWVRDYNLPYSNNLCELLLRMLKTKMKVSYQFKDINYATYFANIMSYTETYGKFGINKYQAIRRLFEGSPYKVEELEKILDNQKTTNS